MLKTLSIVGIGGAIGSILRYLVTDLVETRFVPSTFPYGTLIVNVSGCFVIGLIYALSEKLNITPEWRAFLATGICGGYTTFSAFSYQSVNLIQTGQTMQFFTYVFGSLILGLMATFIPIIVVKQLA